MFDFAEKALLTLAEKYTPKGTNAIALTHQWLHSLVNRHKPYAHSEGVDHQILIEELNKSGLLFDVEEYSSSMKNRLPISRIGDEKFTFIDLFAGIILIIMVIYLLVILQKFQKNIYQTMMF